MSAHKTDWDEKLFSAVYAYNTTKKSTTGKTPYFLVFGQEVLQEIETEIKTFRILASQHAEKTEDLDQRFKQIDNLEESRKEALDQLIGAQNRRKGDFDQKLPEDNGIREGGLVLLYDNRHSLFPGKFHTQWTGPFRVSRVYLNGSLQLENLDGIPHETRVNGSRVKMYHPLID